MAYQVALNFEDGVTRFITCESHETVAEASYRSRINIPLDCRDGACGTCKAFCVSGEYDGGDYIEDALSDEEAEQGYVLPCQLMPESDLVLEIASTSEFAKTGAVVHTGTISDIHRYSPTTVKFTVDLDDRDKLAFLPGQYVNVKVPGTDLERSYSFCSGTGEKAVSFLVRITEGGAMSGYLKDKAEFGDRIEFTGPMGTFYLRELTRPALFLAGGTGLAPILSMLDRLVGEPPEHPVHLLYGVSTDEDLVELDTIQQYAGKIPQLTFDYCVADERSSAPNKGFVTSLLGPEQLHDGDVDVYLCGPPAMVDAVRSHLNEAGVTPANFYNEKFQVAAEVGR